MTQTKLASLPLLRAMLSTVCTHPLGVQQQEWAMGSTHRLLCVQHLQSTWDWKEVTLRCVRKSRHSALCSKKSSLYAVLKKNSSLCAFRNSRHCAHFKKGVLNRVCPFGRNLKNKEWQEWVATSDSERSSTAWESIEVNTWKVSAYLLIKTWFFGPTRALLFYHMGGPRLWKWYFSLQLATSNHT